MKNSNVSGLFDQGKAKREREDSLPCRSVKAKVTAASPAFVPRRAVMDGGARSAWQRLLRAARRKKEIYRWFGIEPKEAIAKAMAAIQEECR